jgi:putative inorganic carbon (HCO3(-)) transporter
MSAMRARSIPPVADLAASAAGALVLGLLVAGLSGSWSRGLLGAVCGAFVVWIAREPRVGLFAILVAMPLDRYGRLIEAPVVLTAYHVVLLVTLGAWSWRLLRHRAKVRWSAVDAGMAVLVFAAFWSLPLSLARGATAIAIVRVVFSAAFVLLFENLADDRAWARRLTTAFAVTAVASAGMAIVQYLVPGFPVPMLHGSLLADGGSVSRAAAFFEDPNHFGAFMSVAVVGFAAAAAHARSWRHATAWMAAAATAGMALLLTLSRGSWVGTVAGLVAVGLTAPLGRRARILAGIAGVLVVVALAAPASVRDRALSSLDVNRDPSAATRWYMIGSTAAMARDHWLFGVGLSAYDMAYPPYRAQGIMAIDKPHEVPLALVAETGVPGLLAQFAIVIGVIVELRRRSGTARSPYGSAAVAALAALAVGMLFEYYLYVEYVWLFVALAVIAGRLRPVAAHDVRGMDDVRDR